MRDAALRVGVATVAVAVFGAPFLALASLRTVPVGRVWQQAAHPLATSLSVSAVVLALLLVLGTPVAWTLARGRLPGRSLVEAVLMLQLLTPPLVLGLLLALTYGPYTPLGRMLAAVGLSATNSLFALGLASFYEAAPYYVLGAAAAFAQVDPDWEAVAATLGLAPWRAAWHVILPQALPGLAMAAAMAWARAVGAFGAVLIVAYHPYGLPLWTWLQLELGGVPAALAVAALLLAVSLPWPLVAWRRSRNVAGGR